MSIVVLTDAPIEKSFVKRRPDPETGATVIFNGTVRGNTGDRRIKKMVYEAYKPMAEKELDKIIRECSAEYRVTDISVIHRLGVLRPGEESIRVVVTSSHRREAFQASIAVIDRIKQTVPIWKKEIYEDETEHWIHAECNPKSAIK